MVEELTDYLYKHIRDLKYNFISVDDVPDILRRKLGESYTSEISIAVKNSLMEHKKVTFFKEGNYIHDTKFYYCTGSWLTIRGVYDNPVEAKFKLGWYSWQKSADDDGAWLD